MATNRCLSRSFSTPSTSFSLIFTEEREEKGSDRRRDGRLNFHLDERESLFTTFSTILVDFHGGKGERSTLCGWLIFNFVTRKSHSFIAFLHAFSTLSTIFLDSLLRKRKKERSMLRSINFSF